MKRLLAGLSILAAAPAAAQNVAIIADPDLGAIYDVPLDGTTAAVPELVSGKVNVLASTQAVVGPNTGIFKVDDRLGLLDFVRGEISAIGSAPDGLAIHEFVRSREDGVIGVIGLRDGDVVVGELREAPGAWDWVELEVVDSSMARLFDNRPTMVAMDADHWAFYSTNPANLVIVSDEPAETAQVVSTGLSGPFSVASPGDGTVALYPSQFASGDTAYLYDLSGFQAGTTMDGLLLRNARAVEWNETGTSFGSTRSELLAAAPPFSGDNLVVMLMDYFSGDVPDPRKNAADATSIASTPDQRLRVARTATGDMGTLNPADQTYSTRFSIVRGSGPPLGEMRDIAVFGERLFVLTGYDHQAVVEVNRTYGTRTPVAYLPERNFEEIIATGDGKFEVRRPVPEVDTFAPDSVSGHEVWSLELTGNPEAPLFQRVGTADHTVAHLTATPAGAGRLVLPYANPSAVAATSGEPVSNLLPELSFTGGAAVIVNQPPNVPETIVEITVPAGPGVGDATQWNVEFTVSDSFFDEVEVAAPSGEQFFFDRQDLNLLEPLSGDLTYSTLIEGADVANAAGTWQVIVRDFQTYPAMTASLDGRLLSRAMEAAGNDGDSLWLLERHPPRISFVNTASDTITRTALVADDSAGPVDLDLLNAPASLTRDAASGMLYATPRSSPSVYRIDPATGTTTLVSETRPDGMNNPLLNLNETPGFVVETAPFVEKTNGSVWQMR